MRMVSVIYDGTSVINSPGDEDENHTSGNGNWVTGAQGPQKASRGPVHREYSDEEVDRALDCLGPAGPSNVYHVQQIYVQKPKPRE